MSHNFSTLLEFEKLHNTRDLGGMKNSDGRSIVPGKLIRSGHLSKLPESDIIKLQEMIDTIVDFRSDEELEENPDVIFPNKGNSEEVDQLREEIEDLKDGIDNLRSIVEKLINGVFQI